MAIQKETIAQAPSGRVKRTPISTRNVLSVKGMEPGFVYRIVNDSADRILAFQDAGYELVDAKDVIIGDKRVNNAKPEGTVAQVSVGQGDKAFLMRQRVDFYKEDQDRKQTAISQQEETMKQEVTKLGGKFENESSTKY